MRRWPMQRWRLAIDHDLKQQYIRVTLFENAISLQRLLESLDRARAALHEVAKAQAFTVVFEISVAPYGANDLTQPTLTAMNAKK